MNCQPILEDVDRRRLGVCQLAHIKNDERPTMRRRLSARRREMSSAANSLARTLEVAVPMASSCHRA